MRLAQPADTGTERAAAERRLMLVIGGVVFVDTMFYAVIAPLLPELAHQLRLSKLSAGVMTAAYPVGTLLGSLPSGVLIVRRGPRFTETGRRQFCKKKGRLGGKAPKSLRVFLNQDRCGA
jgi:MFS family permease